MTDIFISYTKYRWFLGKKMVFKKWNQVMNRTGNEPIVFFLFHQRFLFLWPLPTSKGTLKRVIQSCFAFFYNEADTFLNSCLNFLLLPFNLHPFLLLLFRIYFLICKVTDIWFEKSRFWQSEKKNHGCWTWIFFSSSSPKNSLVAPSKSFFSMYI